MDRSQLLKMSQEQLDELFKQSPPGDIPEGAGAGAPVIFPGSWFAKFFAWLSRWFLWQGKTFDARGGSLRNLITPFSLPATKARVYKAPSWLDEKEAIVLDYSRTSLLAHWIRDEIREVAPGLYLGKVWWGRRRLIDFIVSFQYQPAGEFGLRLLSVLCLAVLVMGVWLAARLSSDRAVAYESIEDHFTYGSVRSDPGSGFAFSIFKLLQRLFLDHIRGPAGYDSFGLIYEKDKDGNLKDLPIGF